MRFGGTGDVYLCWLCLLVFGEELVGEGTLGFLLEKSEGMGRREGGSIPGKLFAGGKHGRRLLGGGDV